MLSISPAGQRLLLTTNATLGPAAGAEPARSEADLLSIRIASVPVPVMLEMVTVRVVRPLPVTLIRPFAVPVLTKCTLVEESETYVAPV